MKGEGLGMVVQPRRMCYACCACSNDELAAVSSRHCRVHASVIDHKHYRPHLHTDTDTDTGNEQERKIHKTEGGGKGVGDHDPRASTGSTQSYRIPFEAKPAK